MYSFYLYGFFVLSWWCSFIDFLHLVRQFPESMVSLFLPTSSFDMPSFVTISAFFLESPTRLRIVLPLTTVAAFCLKFCLLRHLMHAPQLLFLIQELDCVSSRYSAISASSRASAYVTFFMVNKRLWTFSFFIPHTNRSRRVSAKPAPNSQCFCKLAA